MQQLRAQAAAEKAKREEKENHKEKEERPLRNAAIEHALSEAKKAKELKIAAEASRAGMSRVLS